MRVRLRTILVIVLTNLVIILLSVFVGTSYARDNIKSYTEADMLVVADIADRFVSLEIRNLKYQIEDAANVLTLSNTATLHDQLTQASKKHSEFIGLSIMDNNGSVIADTGKAPASKALLNNEYIQKAFIGETSLSSTVPTNDGVKFYLATPVPNSANHILVATLDGLYFSDLTSEYTIWKTGHIFIDDNQGNVIANVRHEWVQNRQNFIEQAKDDPSSEPIAVVINKVINKERGIAYYSINNDERVCAFTPIAGSAEGWALGIVAPLSESPISDFDRGLYIMALIAVVLNILAAIIASNFIKRPFERVAALQEQAEESSRAKSSFLAHMSHEIRTPLNAVVGLSDLVLSEDKLQTGTADKLEKIHDSGLTILSIINDILDISKIESGKFEIVESKYDTPSLINDIVILNIVRIDEKPIEFKLIVDENIPGMLFGDELRVKQIFNNLLSNAFKYTDSGVVEWHTTFEVDGDYVWLISSVKDTGIGIKPADMAQLFTDYYQVEKSSDRKLQGTGLGLAIAKRLVDAMHGTISVESEFGRGSTFSLRLRQGYIPSMPIGKAITNSLSSIQYARLKYKSQTRLIRDDFSYARVLIVDDITTNIDVAKGMMKPYKMMIDSATSGPQAIEMIRSASPKYNAVFMDHMMPGMDGIEAVRIIREEIGTDYAKSVPIIALTANAIAGNEKMFLENGFQAFVAKPIDITRLDVILRQWVRNKDLEQELGMSVFEAMKPIAFVDEEDGESLAAPVVFSKVGTGKGDTNVCSSASGSSTFTTVDLDISGINIEKALKRFDGDEAVLVDVLRSYAENTPELLADMKNYLAKNDLTDFSIVAHGIKGSSYGICADGVGVAAEELEKASKAKDLDTISARFNTFEESVLALLKDIDSTLVLVDESIIKPLAPTPDPELLQELRAACKAYDINRVNAAMSRLEAFSYEDGNKLIRWLRERVRDMDFEEILAMDFSEISIVSKTGEIS